VYESEGRRFAFFEMLDELHACRQQHLPEVEFVCSTLLALYREVSGDAAPHMSAAIGHIAASSAFKEMWRLMYAPQPPDEFARAVSLLGHVQSLCMAAVSLSQPTLAQCELVLAVPPINCDGSVAWYDVWLAVRVLGEYSRVAVLMFSSTRTR
jgi:hypothetical protein